MGDCRAFVGAYTRYVVRTVSFGPILQTEGQREGGVVLEKLGGEGVPPEAVTVLK